MSNPHDGVSLLNQSSYFQILQHFNRCILKITVSVKSQTRKTRILAFCKTGFVGLEGRMPLTIPY
jgi:hypothetical protein